MVMCNAIVIVIVIIEHDWRRSELPDGPIDMEHDNNRKEE